MKDLTPEQLHALAVVAKGAGKVRDNLDVDEYDVDFSCRIQGTLHVSGNQTVTISKKPSAVDVAALLLGTYGPKKRVTMVQDLIKSNYADALDDDLRALATELIDGLSSQATQHRRGSVSGKITSYVE